MKKTGGYSTPKDREEFDKCFNSVSYVALQEGILPSALLMICILNINLIEDKD